jgi:hypothetical protein
MEIMGGEDKWILECGGKIGGEEATWKRRLRLKDIIEMDLQEVDWGVD